MTPEQASLVRASWAALAPRLAELTDRFYEALFQLDPEARALFDRTDRGALGRKLAQTLDEIVGVIEEPGRLVSVLAPLGRRHRGYGVDQHHYDLAGAALLTAIRETGNGLSAEAEQAWREVYGLVAAVMLRAGDAPPQRPAAAPSFRGSLPAAQPFTSRITACAPPASAGGSEST